ncbi:MAG: aminoacyl-tRNA deacylase [Rhodococcus sp. (in: high G+C Gram-positive bacteria)]|uniref:aminoacyl-tRNA deacylase n=1 Tax=Rhodococcus sp. TaxID=1831 RepID=UPI003BB51F30
MASTSTPATTLLTRRKVPHRVHEYDHDTRAVSHSAGSRAVSYGTEAVDILGPRLGVEAAQVFKTLMVKLSDGKLAVAVIPVPAKLSLKSVAGALGVGKAVMAEPADAERATGYVLGGISPLGQRSRLRTVVDESAARWGRMLCSAGRRGLEIELTPADLIRLTGAVVAPITAGRHSRGI